MDELQLPSAPLLLLDRQGLFKGAWSSPVRVLPEGRPINSVIDEQETLKSG